MRGKTLDRNYRERSFAHERHSAALRHEGPILLERAVMKLDETRVGPRFRLPNAQNLCRGIDRIALEQRIRKTYVAHSKIGDRRADREIAHRQSEQQPERKKRIHKRPPPLGLARRNPRRCARAEDSTSYWKTECCPFASPCVGACARSALRLENLRKRSL